MNDLTVFVGRTALGVLFVPLVALCLYAQPPAPQAGTPGVSGNLQLEAAVRAQLRRPDGELSPEALASVVTLDAKNRDIRSLDGLTALTNLTRIDLSKNPNLDTSTLPGILDKLPQLVDLSLDSRHSPSDSNRTKRLLYRIQTERVTVLGDRGMTMRKMWGYARSFETAISPSVARDTGLRPSNRKPAIRVYGDRETWDSETAHRANRLRAPEPAGGSVTQVAGFFNPTTQHIFMSHQNGATGTVNSVLLAHEYLHWTARLEGNAVDLPSWFNEGLAFNISWRIQEGLVGWLPPFGSFRAGWWDRIARTNKPVPILATYGREDEYVMVAVAHLLETSSPGALPEFFRLTRSGQEFSRAFQRAFGQTTEAFQRNFEARVVRLRTDFAAALAGGVRVSGRVILPPTAAGQPGAIRIRLAPLQGSGATGSTPLDTVLNPDGTFEFPKVRPDTYILVGAFPSTFQPRTVVSDRDLIGLEFQIPPTMNVSGRIVLEDNSPSPRFSVTFVPENEDGSPSQSLQRPVTAGVGPNSTFNIALPKGDYRTIWNSLPTGYRIKSVVMGTVDLIADPLRIATTDGSLPTILVTLAR